MFTHINWIFSGLFFIILFKTEDICRVFGEEGEAKLEGTATAKLLRASQL